MGSNQVFLAIAFLSIASSNLTVQAQTPPGFIYVDCGKPKGHSYVDTVQGVELISDFEFIDTGVIHKVSPEYRRFPNYLERLYDLRSFPSGTRNCFNIRPIKEGNKYIVKARFLYGNYDKLGRLPTFDLYLGANFWSEVSISDASGHFLRDLIEVATTDSMPICLVNTGGGTPFISSIEVRSIPNDIYEQVNSTHALRGMYLGNFGGKHQVFYPDDDYDRVWYTYTGNEWASFDTAKTIATSNPTQPPLAVLQTAASIPRWVSSIYFYRKWQLDTRNPNPYFHVFMHFAELEELRAHETRKFSIYINGEVYKEKIEPAYLRTTTELLALSQRHYTIEITIYKTTDSDLPPIINAIEIYQGIDVSQLETDVGDVAAITEIKRLYRIERNWEVDPCAPKDFVWEGLTCSYGDSKRPRIISLNLSSCRLTGKIPRALGNLTKLQKLDLSENNLTGSIPDFLAGLEDLTLLDLRGNTLNGQIPKALERRRDAGTLRIYVDDDVGADPKRTIIIAVVAVVGSLLLIVGIFTLIHRSKRRKDRSIQQEDHHITPDTRHHINHRPAYNPRMAYFPSENRQFTYDDLVKFTGNFSRQIGKGAFGSVYHGVLENNVRVAVKVLMEASSRGATQFQTEAIILSKIYHRNLVSLLGYCDDPDHWALVYEYMEEGSLHNHLSGETYNRNSLSWKRRLQIAIDAAQGLEYLHNGCKPSIIHRDVKPTNILINRDMETKIADFGLSKIFERDREIDVSKVVGTPGYLDPEYFTTQKLQEKSDVYSFGIVLLQLVTGLPAFATTGSGSIYIVDIVYSSFENGAINEVVDERLAKTYDIRSVWRVVELALKCASPKSMERPTMKMVLRQLTDCLELERISETDQGSSLDRNNSIGMVPANQSVLFNMPPS